MHQCTKLFHGYLTVLKCSWSFLSSLPFNMHISLSVENATLTAIPSCLLADSASITNIAKT